MNALRITIVTGPFFPTPPAPCGAVERLWHDMARLFAAQGQRVTMISRRHPDLANREVSDGVKHIRIGGFRRSESLNFNLAKDLYYSARCLAHLPKADILVTNVFWLPALVSLVPGWRFGRIVVNVQRFPKSHMWLYGRVARLATVSSAVEEAVFRQTPRVSHLTRTIPNPVDTRFFRPPAQRRDSTDELTIIYTGRIHPEKGVHLLAEAFAELHQRHETVRLRIVGPSDVDAGGGGERYLTKLRTLAGQAPIEILPAEYDRAKLAGLLQLADIFCYPSLADRGESFGIAPLEAMATGLPVVVSGLKCFEDFVEHEKTGLVFDHRAENATEKLVANLERLVVDKDLREYLSDRSASRAREFDNRHVCQAYLDDFAELVARI